MQQLSAFCHNALILLQVRCCLLADASACCQALLSLYKSFQSLLDALYTVELHLHICQILRGQQVYLCPVGSHHTRGVARLGQLQTAPTHGLWSHHQQAWCPVCIPNPGEQSHDPKCDAAHVSSCLLLCMHGYCSRCFVSVTASKHLVRPLFSLQYSKLTEPGIRVLRYSFPQQSLKQCIGSCMRVPCRVNCHTTSPA